MSRFLNEELKKLEPYTPGEQPQDKKYIKLNTNESPYPPSEKVVEAINRAEIEDLRLYPDPECALLKKTIADKFGVKTENVFISNGSDETLSFAFMAFFSKESPVVFPDITYGFYKVYAELYGVKYEEIPLSSDFSVNTEDYINKAANVVIANPNAPTGKCISISEIEKILESNKEKIVLIDEAYVDFGGESCVNLTKKYDNLLVVRTYSKSMSLAGARLGFAIGHEDIIRDLNTIKFSTNPYNINRLTLIAGKEAMLDTAYFEENIKKIAEAREYTEKELTALGFEVLTSKANFIFAKNEKISGKKLYEALREKGILVRHFGKERIKDFVRISIGTAEDMKALVSAAAEIIGEEV